MGLRRLALLACSAGASLGCGLVTDFEFESPPAAGAGGATGASHGSGGGAPSSAGGGGVADCADDETCIAVPADWGPVGLYARSGPAPDCGAGWTAIEAFVGNVVGSVSCSACECRGPVGAGCGPPSFDKFLFGEPMCSNKAGEVTVQPNDCTMLPSVSTKLQPTPVVPGECTASGGTASKSAVTWDAQARLCAPEGAECAGGGVCARGAAPGLLWPCIARVGAHACPSGFEASTTTVYDGVEDTRACSPCTCSVEGGSCTGTMTTYSNSGCSADAEVIAPGTCLSYVDGPFRVKYVPGSTVPGSCAASGGQAMGQVAPASVITVCCTESR